MATIERFEDLVCWQKARELTGDIYKAFHSNKDFGFKDQIQRASVSIVSNIAEGFESGTRKEFVNFLHIAKASAGEVRAQLYIARDIGHIHQDAFTKLTAEAVSCSRLISSFLKKLKASPYEGTQKKQSSC